MSEKFIYVACFAALFGLVDTAPGVEWATNPTPPTGAMNVPVSPILSWTPGDNAIENHVYFGDSYPLAHRGIALAGSWYPGCLEYCTSYMWRIDTVDDQYNMWQGMEWTFTTSCDDPNLGTCWDPLECAGQPKGDADCDGAINFIDLGLLKSVFFSCKGDGTYDCCADFNHDECVNFIDLGLLKSNFFLSGFHPATGHTCCPP